MDVVVLGETIDEILKRIPSLETTTTSGTGLSATDTELLKQYLKDIQVEMQKNNFHGDDQVLVKWLRKLKTVVNDLSDLVGEISANASPQKKSLPFLKANPFKNRVKVINSKAKKVIGELQNVASNRPPEEKEAKKKQTKLAKLDPEIQGSSSSEPVGREKEKKEIKFQLILPQTKEENHYNRRGRSDDDVPIPVVTIVGIAGIGKTTLARLICGDEQVKSHFGSQIWVELCESETFDVESIKERVNETPKTCGNGYLVVLDGLRTEIGDTDLSKLQQMLTGPGGAILITTRSKLVANKITANIRGSLYLGVHNITTVKPHVLHGLNEEDSWSLYRKIRKPSSEDIIMETKIVMDCGGVPLWIITAATFVNNCGGAEAQVAALKEEEEFLRELKFRYYDNLPRLQKLCFAFCSFFPREHLIDVERLIHLWTAEGFLMENNSTSDSAEETFREYFNDFVGRPIFKDMEEDEQGVVRRCRMQPLMHDLARFVSDHEENITVDPEGEKVHEGVLRASFDFSLDISRGIPDSLFEKAKKLRAFLLWKTHTLLPKEMKTGSSTCDKIFKTFKSLRMLDLHDLGIKKLGGSIGELNNLRYLDLSLNKIEKLPDSITKLSNLQTLKLSQCYLLKELPKNIEDLINLKHLELEGCLALTQMPRKIHNLSSLQTLSLFVVSKDVYHLGGLGNLASLNNLRGHLEILHLERLNSSLSEKDMYLGGKKHLQRLTLRWGDEDDQRKVERENKTLDCLQPHSELRVLFIVGYKGGSTLSSWLSSIQCLVKLSLYDCTNCKFLPRLDQLPKLRFLELLRLESLEFIAENSDKDKDKPAAVVFFPSLEELTISDCPKLKSWWEKDKTGKDIPFFACLSKLHVYYCPKLTSMPFYPCLDEDLVLVGSSVKLLKKMIVNRKTRSVDQFSKLKSMQIAGIVGSQPPPEHWLEYFTSLEELDIREWDGLEYLPQGLDHLSSLQRLNIENCQELDLGPSSTTEWESLKNLRSLTIKEIPSLKSLPLGIDKVTSMQDLELHNCPEMTSLPESIGNLKSLGRLVISECNKLASLPKGLKNLESLHTLIILDCALLLPRCQPDTGDDWPQISHIKNKQVMETSRDILDL